MTTDALLGVVLQQSVRVSAVGPAQNEQVSPLLLVAALLHPPSMPPGVLADALWSWLVWTSHPAAVPLPEHLL